MIGLAVAALALAGCSSSDDESADSEVSEATDSSAAGASEEALAEAQAKLAEAEAALAEQQAEVDSLTAEVSTLTTDLDTANASNTDLTAQLETETARADEAEAVVTAIGEQFPITLETSIDEFEIIGRYDVTFNEVYCEGAETCGQVRPAVVGEIIQGTNGLELRVPGAFTAGLLGVEGALMAGTDSEQITTCNGGPRVARVSVTLFGDVLTIASDGTRELAGLGAGVFVEAPPSDGGECGAANIFLSARLTKIPG